MELIDKAINVMIKPAEFFSKLGGETLMDTLTYMLAICAIQLLIGVLTNLGYIAQFHLMVLYWFSGILMIFIVAGLMHLFVMLLGIDREWNKYFLTLKVSVYAMTPFVLLGWIPIVSLIASVWLVYLMVKGISVFYQVKMTKAFLVAILPFALLIALSMLMSI
ncbi:MAG: YIP1 family protein [Candidatus Aenigmatarchaeota archaeon]